MYKEFMNIELLKIWRWTLVMGHVNAKIGKGTIYKHIAGGGSKHTVSNDNGRRLIEFTEER